MRHCFEQPELPELAFRKALGKNRPATLEGGKGGSAPSAPDPYTVAGATTQTNENTAAYNKALNLNNYSNPFGSQTSTITGTDPSTGAPIYGTTIAASQPLSNLIGSTLNSAGNANGTLNNSLFGLGSLMPQYGGLNTQLAGLSPQYAGLNSQYAGLSPQYAGLNSQYAGLSPQYGALNAQLAGLGGQISPEAAQQAGQQGQQAAYAAQTQYLNPQFSQEQTSLESQLANQGLTPGSQAYTNAETNFNNAKQQAYSNAANQSILTGQQIGTQMLQNQLATVGEKAGLLGQQGQNLGAQAGLIGEQGQNLGAQAGLIGQQGQNLGAQAGLFGLQGQNLGAQGSLYGQQASLSQLPYSQLSMLAGLVPGNTGTASSAASPANIAQAFQNQYAGQLQQYNTNVASANSTQSGLFGLGTAGMLALALA